MESNQTRIVQSKTAGYRKALLAQQDNLCRLCGQYVEIEKAVLDHDHRSGRIRAVLHRGCNSILAKTENNYRRFGVSPDQLQAIAPVVYSYISKDYTHMPFHYSHRVKPKPKSKPKPKPKAQARVNHD